MSKMKLLQGMRVRKRSLLSALCVITLVYAAVQLYVQDEYSPLQLLATVESEASRLLKFINLPQVVCNDSLATGNSSRWLICVDAEIGALSLKDDQKAIVYSVGPEKEFSFEHFVSWNISSTKVYMFSHKVNQLKESIYTDVSKTTLHNAVIVPNDPADFARNSFDSQTLNSVMQTLQHDHIDLLKLDTFMEPVQAFDVLRFLISDHFLKNVKELHFVIKLDKLEEDFIYSWYRVLYSLFNTAGFRLYHTSASDPLCLQDTIMQSCSYFLSWIRKPVPHVFVLYPPAIDGSDEYEEDRLLNYFHRAKSKEVSFTSVDFKVNSRHHKQDTEYGVLSLQLSVDVLEKSAQSCNVIFVSTSFKVSSSRPSNLSGCKVNSFSFSGKKAEPVIFYPDRSMRTMTDGLTILENIIKSNKKTILVLEVQEKWEVLDLLASADLLQYVDELMLWARVFSSSERGSHTVMRMRYSQLKRIEEFSFSLVHVVKLSGEDLKYEKSIQEEVYSLHYLKDDFL